MTEWIKFKTRPFTDQELAKGYDRNGAEGMWDCPVPEEEGEILVSDGEFVYVDYWFDTGDYTCLESTDFEDCDRLWWMAFPEPPEVLHVKGELE